MKNKLKKELAQRDKKFKNQRKKRGWDDSDTWALDGIIAKFALPRLKRFRKIHIGFPISPGMTEESWNDIIDDMIYALEVCERELDTVVSDCDWDRVSRGLKYFGERFRDLWW